MTPISTYRLQLHKSFTLKDIEGILEYLYEIGISTIYASPITRAIKDSQHGYDVANPQLINPEIGTEMEWKRISQLLQQKGMNWLQDIVPNHMAFAQSNELLYDVLERGKASEYYCFFDIDTDLTNDLIGYKLMAPFLGKTLTECLQQKELTLAWSEKGFVIRYFDQDYPIAIPSYRWISSITSDCPAALSVVLDILEQTAHGIYTDWQTGKRQSLAAIRDDQEVMTFIQRRLVFFNDRPALLEELLDNQHYILTHAHLAANRINYRRFFTVNSLICLRMENDRVFNAYHTRIREWYTKGYIQGVRVDHIDGLANPRQYFDDLRILLGRDCYCTIEKILSVNESLPASWQVQGTTGYDFLACIDQLLVDPEGLAEVKDFYRTEIVPGQPPYETLVFNNKYRYLTTWMGGELDNLVEWRYTRCPLPANPPGKDQFKAALAIFMAAFPAYRLYPDDLPTPTSIHPFLQQALAVTREETSTQLTSHWPSIVDYLEQSLHNQHFFDRLMQFTGPLAAKGIEDTSFYNYNPLIALNEVGNSPATKGLSVQDFHKKMHQRLQQWPHALNAGTTHDTKRGEDARIRLQTLTAIPEEWKAAVMQWRSLNKSFIRQLAPSPNDEYFIYQSLLGGIPADLIITKEFKQRFHDFLTKALREAKDATNYDTPNQEYEKACHDFVDSILQEDTPFLESFIPFAQNCIQRGMDLSLSQLLLRLTAPGIPDMYQGAECWECSFVDPDNRRPVDYNLRKRLLQQIKEEGTNALHWVQKHKKEGATKLFTLYKTLHYRNRHPHVFLSGEYIPVDICGPYIAYCRHHSAEWALIIVPLIRLQTTVPASISLMLPSQAPQTWTDLFTDETITSQNNILTPDSLLSKFPITLLTASTNTNS